MAARADGGGLPTDVIETTAGAGTCGYTGRANAGALQGDAVLGLVRRESHHFSPFPTSSLS